MSRRVFALALGVAIGVASYGATASDSLAAPGPIRLVSSNGIEQADYAESPALSADGRFVAFRGQVAGVLGIFRKDLTSGELVLVASGEANREPSISADGRYISFTTSLPLDPGDDPEPGTSDVYVADMATTPPSYELASAIDGCDPLDPGPHPPCGLAYEGASGSLASGRVSLASNGREVVFVTTAASDLTEPAAAPGTFPTPALQVAVRNLETDATILISGALDPSTGLNLPDAPVAGGAVASSAGQRLPPGASISADGTTVAWLAQHPAEQVPLGGSEAASIVPLEAREETYDEPLVRRVPDPADPKPATRRIVTGRDFPEMVSGGNQSIANTCANATGWNLGGVQTVPVLSADGGRVALIGQPDGYADAFVVDLAGASAGQVRRLTKSPLLPLNNPCEAPQTQFVAGNAEIKTIAIAPEGERIALTTRRKNFILSPPNLVTTPPSAVGTDELYLVDLGTSTLERLTHGTVASEPSLVEEPGLLGANSVSFDGDGEVLAFSSRAYNLVAADGNGASNGASPGGGGGSDAFIVSDPRSGAPGGSSRISSPPPAIRPRTRWALTAHASSRPDGSVRVAVSVPGPGNLSAVARTEPERGKHARKVAASRRKARLASVLIFILHPARGLGRQVRERGGLEATLRLHFAGKGGKPLTDEMGVRFRLHRGGKKGPTK